MIRSLLKGTFILTIAGFLTKLIGFLYKIYLSNILEAKMLGIYQLVFPVFAVCFTLFGAGLQTAISQLIAANNNKKYVKKILLCSIELSLLIAGTLSLLVFIGAGYIADNMLGESSCSEMLKLLALAFPGCAVAVCINGCYFGLKKASVPALTQLIEQIARVIFVYIFITLLPIANEYTACKIAVCGIAVGETVSMIYSLIMVIRLIKKMDSDNDILITEHVYNSILKLAIPLTGNKLIVSILHSVETIIIPIMLKNYGMSSDDALSVFGVLTGMAMPFIMFPSTITNSLAVMLLPTVSEAAASNDSRIKDISKFSIYVSLVFGIMSTILFMTIGSDISVYVFNNQSIGLFVKILSILCPFLFVSTTLASIINGMGKTYITFFITIVGLAIRILITVKTVPVNGISGYLISLLISQIVVTIMSVHYYKKSIKMHTHK